MRLLHDAIRAAPSYELNYNDLGAVLWDMDERARAYENFERALRINAESPEARDNLLNAAAALDKVDAAKAFLAACRIK